VFLTLCRLKPIKRIASGAECLRLAAWLVVQQYESGNNKWISITLLCASATLHCANAKGAVFLIYFADRLARALLCLTAQRQRLQPKPCSPKAPAPSFPSS
jgi:hypothetical protein